MTTIPVAEIFGPTIQGEGYLAGLPTYFLRVGGCDFSCRWCDSGHAVLPEEVRKLTRFDPAVIAETLLGYAEVKPGPDWLTISGGNPGLYDLTTVVNVWQQSQGQSGWGRLVAVETQASKWQPWFNRVNLLTMSPKAPSSGMSEKNSLDYFLESIDDSQVYQRDREFHYILKVVVFDEADYLWARQLHGRYPLIPFYLSTGTAMGGLSGEWAPPDVRVDGRLEVYTGGTVDTEASLLHRYRWLVERAMNDPRMADVRVFPQLHALIWGITTKGV